MHRVGQRLREVRYGELKLPDEEVTRDEIDAEKSFV
jgi:hypothetical protein